MKNIFKILTKQSLTGLLFIHMLCMHAQNGNSFADHLRIGGSLGVAFGNGYTDISVAPGALYEFNQYFGLGAGLQGTYVNYKNYYKSVIYGGSVIGVFNPIEQLQLSAEVEQLRVNLTYDDDVTFPGPATPTYNRSHERNFWNTALFFGVGYRTNNVTVGLRYNVLFREEDRVYSDALMPFIRVYF
ncbi:hypothetical protein [Flavobacterium rhizosphaerae]|uniref:Alpha-ketoglutarate decarboxylase n=1 Tax=Flavobacterium rhizosphaerae TaxID=3163298 RepID=A0ABW8YSI3_9FLAO